LTLFVNKRHTNTQEGGDGEVENENGVPNEEDPRIELGKRVVTQIREIVRTPGLILESDYGPGEESSEIVILFTLVNTGGSKVEDIQTLINDCLLELLKQPEFGPYELKTALEIQP